MMKPSQAKICQDILERIHLIELFTLEGEAHFMKDIRTQEAVIRCFEVIGEAVKRLDPSLTTLQPHIDWKAYAGFRDVLIHQYDNIIIDTVYQAIQDDLPPLKLAIQALLILLTNHHD